MADILKDYFDALDRLKAGNPINLPKSYRITNDSVSLEAGRKKGTIKKSRPIFSELIAAIAAAAEEESKPNDDLQSRLQEAKDEIARYRSLWEEALAREVSLIKQLWDEREAWSNERLALTKGKISPIRKP